MAKGASTGATTTSMNLRPINGTWQPHFLEALTMWPLSLLKVASMRLAASLNKIEIQTTTPMSMKSRKINGHRLRHCQDPGALLLPLH